MSFKYSEATDFNFNLFNWIPILFLISSIVVLLLYYNYKKNIKVYEPKDLPKATAVERIIACAIDFLIISLIVLSIELFVFIIPQLKRGKSYFEIMMNSSIWLFFCMIIFLALILFRDCLGQRSIGKRIMKLYIGNLSEPVKPVGFMKRILRNLTLIFFPLEIILLVASQDKERLGDKLTYTTVYKKK